MKKSILFLFSTLFISRILWCQEGPPVYIVYKSSGMVVIDGRIEEDYWKRIPQTTGFCYLGELERYSDKQTFFQIGWDSTNIFIGIICEEPDILKIKPAGKDGGPLWQEDSIEIFLSPRPPEYYQIVINPLGSKTQAKGKKIHYEVSASTSSNFWSVEVKIPFQEIGCPKNNEMWRFNIGRNITIGDSKHSTWAKLLAGHFHDFKNFGYIKFSEDILSEQKAKKISEQNREKVLLPVLSKIKKKVERLKKEIEEIRNGEKIIFYKKLEDIIRNTNNTADMSYMHTKEIFSLLKLLSEEVSLYKLKILIEK